MITVLRLGHRCVRDKRITTHAALVARAFGAQKMIFTGDADAALIASVQNVNKKWGSDFLIEYKGSWKSVVAEHRKTGFSIIHLTFYGVPLMQRITAVKKQKNVMIIIGGEKVPRDVYEIADYNLSVTSQPHSEVAALALFLDRYFEGNELAASFGDGELAIIPSEKSKKVVKKVCEKVVENEFR